ncbi:Osmotic growth protein [Hypoxylon texense]
MGEIPDDDFQPDFLGFSWGFFSFQHATATATAATKRQEDASGRRSVGLPNNNSWIHRSLVSAKQQQQISSGQAKPTPADCLPPVGAPANQRRLINSRTHVYGPENRRLALRVSMMTAHRLLARSV